MKKLFLLLAGVFLLTACEKEPNVAPKVEEESQFSALDRYLTRVAEEGIAMLGDTPTRAGARRTIDPARTRAFVKATTRSEEDTLFYVVNFADSTGFALVDADTTSPTPLIAVTEQGNYSPGEVTNTGFDLYIDMLAQNSTRGIIPDVEIDSLPYPNLIVRTEIEDYYTNWVSKGPYVQVKWGQGQTNGYSNEFPYNKYCYDEYGRLSLAGCVAVAIAQIMSFHQKPDSYVATFGEYDELCLLEWNILNTHCGGSGFIWSQVGIEQVAYLMREIGEQAPIDYSPNISTADIDETRNAFTAFGYTSNPVQEYSYDTIVEELDAARPVWMGAYLSAYGAGGHAWVVDGYKERSHIYRKIWHYYDGTSEVVENSATYYHYVHVNWGADGNNNGYFAPYVFDMDAGYEYDTSDNPWTNNYAYGRQIITGIEYEN